MAQILHHFLHQTLQHIDAIQELTHSPAMARYIQKIGKKYYFARRLPKAIAKFEGYKEALLNIYYWMHPNNQKSGA